MPQALVPLNDPMARVSGQPNLQKVNQYRLGVDQAAAVTNNDADSTAYCTNLYYTAPSRLVLNQNRFSALVSPDPVVATSLYAYMAFRLFNTFGDNGLGCQVHSKSYYELKTLDHSWCSQSSCTSNSCHWASSWSNYYGTCSTSTT
jgi:hypothetical protein